MQHNIIKLISVSALVAVMSGCSTYTVRTSDPNSPFCTLAGAALGGGTTAIASLGGPAIVGEVMVGATIGNYICSSDGQAVQQTVAVETPQPQQKPVEVVRELDNDGDGVIDRLDRCPNTPAGSKVDVNGCPAVLMTLTGVNFEFDSSRIDVNSENILNQAVNALNEARSVKIRIVGHTDNVGTEAYNLQLSEKRSSAVRDYLVSKGIAASRLTAVGAGESQPVAPNTTDNGRHQNRRVELHVEESNTM